MRMHRCRFCREFFAPSKRPQFMMINDHKGLFCTTRCAATFAIMSISSSPRRNWRREAHIITIFPKEFQKNELRKIRERAHHKNA